MMVKLHGLMLGTALAIASSTPLLAQSNQSFTTQSGDDNSIRIDQALGGANQAGESAPIGPALGNGTILQSGDGNRLRIEQFGSNNAVGTLEDPIAAIGDNFGIEQSDNYNRLVIIQSSSDNAVYEVLQNGGSTNARWNNNAVIEQAGGTGNFVYQVNQQQLSASSTPNVVRISQNGTDNLVGSPTVGQRFSTNFRVFQEGIGNGDANRMVVEQNGTAQTLQYIRQRGAANRAMIEQSNGSANDIRRVLQFATGAPDTTGGNRLDIVQAGSQNYIFEIDQSNVDGGDVNQIDLTFVGSFNGDGLLTGVAGSSGLSQGSYVMQEGSSNIINTVFAGDGNLFGFSQSGYDNLIAGAIDGSNNQIAVVQGNVGTLDSSDNQALLAYGPQADGNNHRIDQFGTSNAALLAVTSDINQGTIVQNGNGNFTSMAQ